jgi:DNA-binding PadR family transcriptional regulator
VDREEVVDNRLRRYYRLTPDGEKLIGAVAEAPLVITLWLWSSSSSTRRPAGLPYLHAEHVLAGLGGHRLGSGL